MSLFIAQLINGLTAGSVYAMIAVGYSLVYGIMQQINFAHGYIYMFGAFMTLAMIVRGVPLAVAILVGVGSGVLVSMVIERFAYRPVRSASRMAPTVTAVGAGLVVENVAQLIWGPTTRPFPFPLQSMAWQLGDHIVVTPLQLIVFGTGVAMALLLYLITVKTNFGRSMRAIRDDLPTAELMGIHVNRIIVGVYALGAALGVIGGILFGAYYQSISVSMGLTGTLYAFTATIIGGLGSIWGPFAGGVILGVLQALAVGFINSGLENTTTFVLLIVLLLVRPAGLGGLKIATRL